MFRSYTLQPTTVHSKPISFEWNPETGEIRGEAAAQVKNLAKLARRTGEVVGHPYPTAHTVSDPLRSASELAVVLGNDWVLPADLTAAYPQVETDDLIAAIDTDGVEHLTEFRLLY